MWLVCLWLVILTWGFWPNPVDQFLYPRQAFFEIGGWAIVAWGLFRPSLTARWVNPRLRWFLLWVITQFGYHFWSMLLTPHLPEDQMIFNWFVVMPTMDVILSCLLVYVFVTYYFRQTQAMPQVMKTICWLSASVAAYTLVQYLGCDQWFQDTPSRQWTGLIPSTWMFATMGNISYVSMFLAITTPCFLYFKERRYLVGLALVLLSLWLMHKSYGILGASVGLLTYGWLRVEARLTESIHLGLWRAGLVGVLCWSVILLYLKRAFLLSNPRWLIWKEMGHQLIHCPLTGHGLGSFAIGFFQNWERTRQAIPALGPSKWFWAHNDPWQAVYELGAIGLGLALWVLERPLRCTVKHRGVLSNAIWLSCAVSATLISLMNFPLHFVPTCALCLIIWSQLEVQPEVS